MSSTSRDSIAVSIPACHAGDPGSIPGRGAFGVVFRSHRENFENNVNVLPYIAITISGIAVLAHNGVAHQGLAD